MSNNNTPNGKRLGKLTANYQNLLKEIRIGEEKLKKYRKKERTAKLIADEIENKLEKLKRNGQKLHKELKNSANAYEVKIYGKK